MTQPFRCAVAALLVSLAAIVAAPTASAEPAAVPPQATRINDIDGDGKLDVVFVDSGEAAETSADEKGRPGSVQVLFGDGKVQHVSTVQLHDGLFEDSSFGSALVVGDLNRDGYADVVVADQSAGESYSGRVWALWGSATGISARRTTVLATGRQEAIGTSMAFIPFPEPVLAIGASAIGTGFVDLYRVKRDGRLGDRRRITIGSPGIVGRAYPEANFGASMAASGDLLVIGAPEAGAIWTSGAAYVLQLQPGLRYWATRVLQGSRGVPGAPEESDAFGQAVSILGENVLVTRLCAEGYGVMTADHGSGRVLAVPFSARRCSGAWLTTEQRPDPEVPVPPAASILRRFVAGAAVDEPVIVSNDYTLQIGWPGSQTETDLKGKAPAPVRTLARPAA